MKTFNSKKSGVKTSDIDSAGALDIDAGSGDVSIDSATGSITMGSTLTDGQTLKLGKNGATEMIFTPSGTPGSEKIKLINTSGTDTNAIEIVSSAGSITLSASGNITLTGLPTSDPGSAGALWYNASGALQISLGGA
tara:strand:- start:214 stop:624 length:411 start_codon:yes stop_codon:yes gene_type:complete